MGSGTLGGMLAGEGRYGALTAFTGGQVHGMRSDAWRPVEVAATMWAPAAGAAVSASWSGFTGY